jgi:hypothetical protein
MTTTAAETTKATRVVVEENSPPGEGGGEGDDEGDGEGEGDADELMSSDTSTGTISG